MATILKGAPVSEAINEKIRNTVSVLSEKDIVPTLALVRVGENDGDIYYERSAIRRCEAVGVGVKSIVLPESVSQDELIETITRLNNDSAVHGMLIFRPLPKSISDAAVRAAIAPEKDVDGITEMSLAGVFTGNETGFCPCTAEACIETLDHYGIDCTGKKAAVIGRSLVIGKPVAMLLLAKNATVTVCHTRTRDLPAEAQQADILIVSAGHEKAVDARHLRPGQVVIDVGINTNSDGKMCGDVDFDAAENIVEAITPVPGGIGSVTTSVLIKHVTEAAMRASL